MVYKKVKEEFADNRQPVVSSLSIAFRRALIPTEDREEAKREHRSTLKALVENYADEMAAGKKDGIRHARDLVEVMKMDMLLMGEATERVDNANSIDEIRVTKVAQALDMSDPDVLSVINKAMSALNDANDNLDRNSSNNNKSRPVVDVVAEVVVDGEVTECSTDVMQIDLFAEDAGVSEDEVAEPK